MRSVYLDARMVGKSGHGIASYVKGLVKGIGKIKEDRDLGYELVLLVSSEGQEDPDFLPFKKQVVQSPFLSLQEIFEIPKILKQGQASLYHSPSFSSLRVSTMRSICPWIVTIHDLNHLKFGDFFKKIYYQFLLKPFAKSASALLTISRFSQREIAQWLDLPLEEIQIVENPMEETKKSEEPQEEEISHVLKQYSVKKGKFFLCLANSKPHKNVDFLLKAYQSYQPVHSSEAWPLIVSIEKPSGEYPGVIFAGSIPGREVQVLLRQAGAVLSPSLYEGFGRPPIEGAIVGTPCVVSDIPPHREALEILEERKEVKFVNPHQLQDWKRALEEAARGELKRVEPTQREKLVTRFASKQMSFEMDRIYRNVLGLKA